MGDYKTERTGKRIYSSLVKPPHCNITSEIIDEKYGKLINTVLPNYVSLIIKIIVLAVLLYFNILEMKTGQIFGYPLDFSSLQGMVTLVPFIILLFILIYHLLLLTKKVKLYEQGFKIGSKEYFYDDAKNIIQTYQGTRIHPRSNDTKVIKRLVYVITLKRGKRFMLKKWNYIFLKPKMEDLLQNLVEPKIAEKEHDENVSTI